MHLAVIDALWRSALSYLGGPKLISLNEKQRGFPTGLRVMKSETSELLKVEPSFDSVTFLSGRMLSVDCVEVLGCGGVEGAESQRRLKEWEKRQILRRRKVQSTLSRF